MAGERTSKNAAVVDYFIGSLDFINIISNSKVLDFSCLYSDIHSPIDIDVDINKCTCEYGSVPINSMSGEKIKKWDINKKEDFILNLDREKISELENYLEETKSFPADSNIINKAVENITNIFVTSAKKTFGTLKNKSKNENTPQSTRSQDKKPWFNIDCRIARKNARKYRRKYKLNKSIVNDPVFTKYEKDVQTFMLLNRTYKGDIRSVRGYVDSDISILNRTDYDGRTALHIAVAENHDHLVKYFLEELKESIKTDIEDRWNNTALDDAEDNLYYDILMIFKDNDYKVNDIYLSAAKKQHETHKQVLDILDTL
ncbi:Hypothetical predicted protein [Mytilus galloprovincialis]|uniref:Uncharacterized protein n=1 Tax=Mytilus galloprovincialis TaxID=29158 RepID=A0A8B6GFQ1_MYTGA|nr:Hypothetical predicted protein [Mytilus galloprovincialis]